MTYDLKNAQAPRLAGRPLAMVAWMVDSWLFGGMLRRKLTRDVGLDRLRDKVLSEPPTVRPFLPVASIAENRHAEPLPDLIEYALTPALELGGASKDHGGFAFPSIADFHRAYQSGKTTPAAVARRVLDAIRAADKATPPLKAVVAYDETDLVEQARASTERWRNGWPLGVLDGVPIAVKDELDMTPFPTTVGTRFLGRSPAKEDASLVAKLRSAGALLFCKTNMHEIGLGVTGYNPHLGTPRNPYAPGHYTGGSSSGSAAIVAAGLCPMALGADGGGSIRVPAALCGVFGLKGTFGRFSDHGAAPLCWSVAHAGPIAATARDLAISYALLAGKDPRDSSTEIQPPPKLCRPQDSAALDGIRIGLDEAWFSDAQPEIVAACRKAVDGLKARGAEIVKIEVPELDAMRIAHLVSIASEMALSMEGHRAAHRRDFGLDVRINLAIARDLTSRDYVQAQRMRARASAHFETLFEKVDVIATPATGVTAPAIKADALAMGESDLATLGAIIRFAFPANLCGLPAVSIPVGADTQNLPIGLQLMGRPWEEHLLLRLAEAVEAGAPRRAPKMWFPVLDEAVS